MFVKPIMYYTDSRFLYVLFPLLNKFEPSIQKSSSGLFKIISDLMKALNILHSKAICFRTLCSRNLFIKDQKIQILRSCNILFQSEMTEEKKHNIKNNNYMILDSFEYNPPELFDRGWCDKSTDIWGLGV